MSAVKAALKEAKDLIGQKDFRGALKCCKRALNVDKDNYFGWVFIGLCLSELEQKDKAKEAYERAQKIDPKQITAYQGMVTFLEKYSADYRSELPSAYAKLAAFHENPEGAQKYFEVTSKQFDLLMQNGDLDGAVEVARGQLKFCPARGREARANVIKILSQAASPTPEQDAIQLEMLLESLETPDESIQSMENFKTMIKLLYRLRKMETLSEWSVKMHRVFPKTSYPLEWICKVYLEWVTGTLDFESEDMENVSEYIAKLLELNAASTLGKLSQSACLWKQGSVAEAKEALTKILGGNNNPNFYGCLILCRSLVQLGLFSEAETQLVTTLDLLDTKVKEESTRNTLRKELQGMLVNSLYNQGSPDKLMKAKAVLDRIGDISSDLKVIKIKIVSSTLCPEDEFDHGEFEGSIADFSDSEKSLLRAMVSKALGRLDQAESQVEASLKDSPESFEALLILGEVKYRKGDLKKSLNAFLKAAKHNPRNAVPFLFLGHIYRMQGDLDKARKCYQKSFQLNPTSKDAGASLSDTYRLQGAHDSNLKFLTSVTKDTTDTSGEGGHGGWAFLRLGILHLALNEPAKAVTNLQSAIRNVKDGQEDLLVIWESLADAYHARGSHSAALKAYEKVVQLCREDVRYSSKSSLYAQWQIGTIKQVLGKYDEAIEVFRGILSNADSAEYVPALKGLGESILSQAGEMAEAHINKNVVDNCEEALVHLTKAAGLRPDIASLWKLMGEACTMLHTLPASIAIFKRAPGILIGKADDFVTLEKAEIVALGARCFLRSLKIHDSDAGVWHNLALNYQAQRDMQNERVEALTESFGPKAVLAAKKAIALDPKGHAHWNLLGVLAFKSENFALAQHAFIKSTRVESNATAWTNLGFLYLVLGEHELANKSFKEAQNIEPTCLRGWVGQALLAEQTGYVSEAMDLFRHATFLGNEVESSVGYANWVCKTLEKLLKPSTSTEKALAHNRYCLEKMHGVTVASDCLTRYNALVESDPCGLNLLGVMCEREGLLQTSRKALQSALAVLETQQGDVSEERRDKVSLNLGRVAFKLGDFSAAVSHYSAVRAVSFASQSGLAISLYKLDRFEESYNAYQASLSLTEDQTERSHVLTAMASIAFRFQGPDAAKTLLFQAAQLTPPSVEGFYALCVLGIRQQNGQLIAAALKATQPYADDPRYVADIAGLEAIVSSLTGMVERGRRVLSRQIHRFPHNTRLWATMAVYLLHSSSDSPQLLAAAANCARKSVSTQNFDAEEREGEGKKKTLSKEAQKKSIDTSTNLVALSLLLAAVSSSASAETVTKWRERSVKAAMRAVHLNPGDVGAWALLWLAKGGEDERLVAFLAGPEAQSLCKESYSALSLGTWLGRLNAAV